MRRPLRSLRMEHSRRMHHSEAYGSALLFLKAARLPSSLKQWPESFLGGFNARGVTGAEAIKGLMKVSHRSSRGLPRMSGRVRESASAQLRTWHLQQHLIFALGYDA